MILAIISVLQRLRGEAWVGNFVQGLAPAVAVLMVLVAWDVFRGEEGARMGISVGIGAVSLVAYLLKAPSPLVLVAAGIAGVVLLR